MNPKKRLKIAIANSNMRSFGGLFQDIFQIYFGEDKDVVIPVTRPYDSLDEKEKSALENAGAAGVQFGIFVLTNVLEAYKAREGIDVITRASVDVMLNIVNRISKCLRDNHFLTYPDVIDESVARAIKKIEGNKKTEYPIMFDLSDEADETASEETPSDDSTSQEESLYRFFGIGGDRE